MYPNNNIELNTVFENAMIIIKNLQIIKFINLEKIYQRIIIYCDKNNVKITIIPDFSFDLF